MNLQQLRYLCAIADHGLNVSDAAAALFTSQPGVSKQVRQLEDELGVRVFVRAGKRIASVTPAGEAVIATARRALREIENVRRVGSEFRNEHEGTLAIATTHTQARYVLPPIVRDFAARFPRVKVELHQGNPIQVAEHTANGDSDVGIATEALATLPRARHVAVLSVESLRARAARTSARESWESSRSPRWPAIPSSRTTMPSPAARRSTRRSTPKVSCPMSCSPRSIPT